MVALTERVKDGSKGEALVVINACKCLRVIRNWCYGKRSDLQASDILETHAPGNWRGESGPEWIPRVKRKLEAAG